MQSKHSEKLHKIGFLGGGHMAHAIIAGLHKHALQKQGFQVHVFDRNQSKCDALLNRYQTQICVNAHELIAQCDVVVVAVKPQGVITLLKELKKDIYQHGTLILSVAAGVPLAAMQNVLGDNQPLVRAMPNVASAIGEGATAIFANTSVNTAQKQVCQAIMDAIGASVWVNSDEQINTVTALSGSGPAYFLLLVEEMIGAAKSLGLSHDAAHTLALHTFRGIALLASTSDETPSALLEQICTPNGTTERAINIFREHDMTSIVKAAMQSAKDRAQEMAEDSIKQSH